MINRSEYFTLIDTLAEDMVEVISIRGLKRLTRSHSSHVRVVALRCLQRLEGLKPADIVSIASMQMNGESEPRWQAMILLASLLDDDPERLWTFVELHGKSDHEDVRSAVATVILEHLIERDATYLARARDLASISDNFADTLRRCHIQAT